MNGCPDFNPTRESPDAAALAGLDPDIVLDVVREVSYVRGYLDALFLYAWMKDGVRYVGSTGQRWRDAVDKFLDQREVLCAHPAAAEAIRALREKNR